MNYQRIKTTLEFNKTIGHEILKDNSAYKIFEDLYEKILSYNDFDTFFIAYPTLNNYKTEFLDHVRKCPDFDEKNKIPSYHNLGKFIQEKLDGRFVKEETKKDDVSREEHVINWFILNANLKFDTDRDIVQAAFVSLFLI